MRLSLPAGILLVESRSDPTNLIFPSSRTRLDRTFLEQRTVKRYNRLYDEQRLLDIDSNGARAPIQGISRIMEGCA